MSLAPRAALRFLPFDARALLHIAATMSERAQRARTLSEEARAEAGTGPSGPSGGSGEAFACAPNLYVCGHDEVVKLAERLGGLAGVVCCEIDAVPVEPPYPRFHLPLAAAAYLTNLSPERLNEFVRFVDAARSKGPTVIHCTHGRGRSVAVATVYLVAKGVPLREALLSIARSRPRVDCTTGLIATLERVAASLAAAAPPKKEEEVPTAARSDGEANEPETAQGAM